MRNKTRDKIFKRIFEVNRENEVYRNNNFAR